MAEQAAQDTLVFAVMEMLAHRCGKLLQQLALLRCQLGWHLHLHDDILIALAAPMKVRQAAPAQRKRLAALCALRNLQLLRAVNHRHLDGIAEGGASKADRHLAIEVVAAPLENLMVAHVDDQVQIARRPAALARVAFTDQPQPHARIHARRHLDGALPDLADAPAAAARRAGAGDDPARAVTARAGLRAVERAQDRVLRKLDLAGSPALRAGIRIRSGPRPAALARIARLHAREPDRLLHASRHLFQRQLQVFAQVVPLNHMAARTAPGGLRAKDNVEDIAKGTTHARAEPAGEPLRADTVQPFLAVAVVLPPLVLVAENVIRGLDLLELLGRIRCLIQVGMILLREIAIGALQLFRAGGAGNAQNLIVIARLCRHILLCSLHKTDLFTYRSLDRLTIRQVSIPVGTTQERLAAANPFYLQSANSMPTRHPISTQPSRRLREPARGSHAG